MDSALADKNVSAEQYRQCFKEFKQELSLDENLSLKSRNVYLCFIVCKTHFCFLGFMSNYSEDAHREFYEFVQAKASTDDEEKEEESLPKWLIFQPKTKNRYELTKKSEPSPYDVVVGKFKFDKLAGQTNRSFFKSKTQVNDSSFKIFNRFLRDLLNRYANELNDGFPSGIKIINSQTLAISNGILMTFPLIHFKYAFFVKQEYTKEATFKETTLKPYAQVINI